MELEVYCDESGQEFFRAKDKSANKYVLIGSLWIQAEKREELKAAIRLLRDKHNLYGEFKWQKVSASRLEFFLDLVNLFFDRNETEIRYRVIVLPSDKLDAVKFHEADNELMFYKFYYQLLHHWILDDNTYRIFVDLKTNRVRDRLKTLQRVLSNANLLAEIERVQALPSDQVDLLQMVDLLIGAVGYKFHNRVASRAKLRVVQEIERRLGREIQPTPRAEKKFNVFRFQPGGGW